MASTGNGPRSNRLIFDGDENKFHLWQVKFLAYLRIQKLHNILDEGNDDVDSDKNADLYAERIQVLDDRSLSLVMHEAPNDGRKAFKILREHYKPKGKPRIIALYTELTTLNKTQGESITDYIIRAETAASSLRDADETVSDGLLVAMVIKGLPAEFKPFIAVITQSPTPMSFHEFKFADGSRSDDLIKNIGDAKIQIVDKNGQSHTAILRNTLYIPSFSQDIFSVRAATQNGATVSFARNSGNLHSHGTNFPISKRENLYYLDSVSTLNHSSKTVRSLQEWHETMGHCNVKDLLSLQGAAKKMNISDAESKKDFECEIVHRSAVASLQNPVRKMPSSCLWRTSGASLATLFCLKVESIFFYLR
ncbi:CCHC-type zinc finger, nucleic acid binding protein a [Elysia marginata]|uniref:CCHC-type zinc finger, nucleic acid binding protein a n=1 Tax=Elysia marginata TaxID=1093978 RepID=A0AAV4GB75_9GAST|nr:CCHC-type zinc finger, nucleic acid binding protein a [Elysia marginata]